MNWLRHRRFNRAEVIRLRGLVAEQQELIDAYRKRDTQWEGMWRSLRHYAHNNGDLALRKAMERLEGMKIG